MIIRAAKSSLVLGVALFYIFVVFNNLTDYDSNFQFVRHVLMMDSTFPGNHGMWRTLNSPAWHTIFYLTIILWESLTMILWESLTMILCGWGGLRLIRTWRASAATFRQASHMAIVGLTLGLLMWLVAFLDVGGEWFLMWQSKSWNGQEAAFRMFTVIGIVLLFVVQPEPEEPR